MNNIKIILAGLVWLTMGIFISILLGILGKIELSGGAHLWLFYTSYIGYHITNSIFKLIRTVEEL